VKALILSPRTAADIDAQVDKILRAVGQPPPPLDLRILRDHLKLNREYYSSTDDSALRETIRRLTLAGRQILNRPTLLLDAIRKFSLQALWLPDRKRILIDQDVPELKHRWNETHEMGHSIIPWHSELLHGDDKQTLTLSSQAALEAEANYAAGQLLFMRNTFADEARSRPAGFATLRELKKMFGNTMTSTMWRYVEQADPARPTVGVVSAHPHPSRQTEGFDPLRPCRHMMQSSAFAERFSNVDELQVFGIIQQYCGAQRGGLLGAAEVFLTDDRGDQHVFQFETFYNRYEALTLGWHLRPQATRIVRP